MFGKKDDIVGSILFDKSAPVIVDRKNRAPIFIELEGATCTKEDDGPLEYAPRGKIAINPEQIAGYYDHTILINGYKIRVMETYAQIALKILEAMRDT